MDERDEQQYIELSGTVKNVVFQNEENGYTVLRLDVGGDEPMTVVGCLPFAASGEGLTVLGSWEPVAFATLDVTVRVVTSSSLPSMVRSMVLVSRL